MSQAPARRRSLGRGLAALLGDEDIAAAAVASEASVAASSGSAVVVPGPAALRNTLQTLPVAALRSGRYQPRTRFDEAELAELAQSIRTHGLVQPILVRPVRDGTAAAGEAAYEIVAGERRWRAAQLARLHEVPVVVRGLEDGEALRIALIENVQRSDLSPIEEAQAYRRLIDDFGHTREDIGESLGKSRPHIANTLRLLDLPAGVRAKVEAGALTAGHARALIGTPDPAFLAETVIARGMNVRQVEQLATACRQALANGWDGKGMPPSGPAAAKPGSKPAEAGRKSADSRALEQRIETALGVRAELRQGKGERSELVLQFNDFDQLDEAVRRLTRA